MDSGGSGPPTRSTTPEGRLVRTVQHWIAGKTTSGTSDRTAPVFNPATGAQQAEVVLGSARDVEAAVAAAGDAFGQWSQTSISARTKASR